MPLISDDRVIAVISVATTDEQRAFSADDLAVMQTLASEATIALERTRVGDRPRRGARARAARRVDRPAAAHRARPRRRARERRSRRRAARSARRAASSGSATTPASCRSSREWAADGVAADRRRHREPAPSRTSPRASDAPSRSPTSSAAPELDDPALGGLEHLRALGARSGRVDADRRRRTA